MRRLVLFLCLLLLVIPLAVSSVAAQGRWDGDSRFTILVMGVDRRPNARDNFNTRVDSILVLSVDPSTDSIGVLHIPRDLHVAALDSEPLIASTRS